MLLTDTAKTKETALQKKLIEKRNLFGLGVTSLIAACGADGAGGGDDDLLREEDTFTSTLPFKAEELLEPENLAKAEPLEGTKAGGYSATKSDTGTLAVTVEKPGTPMSTTVTLNFSNASDTGAEAGIYKLTDQYNLVISAPYADKNINQGKIFIYWNVEAVIDSSPPDLEIKGRIGEDNIGFFAPEFLQLGGDNNNKLDMVIRSFWVDNPATGGYLDDEGAIYVLWDVKSYSSGASFNLSDANLRTGATAGSLAIYGAGTGDYIGTHAPEFLQLGGVADEGDTLQYDMIIRSHKVDSSSNSTATPGRGAIYVLWDVEDYYKNGTDDIAHKTIDLGAANNDTGHYATAGLLTIKGAAVGDQIGTRAPDFLQLGGAENNHDMVIRSNKVGSGSTDDATVPGKGAIYILWDVEEYAGENIDIILDSNYDNVKGAGLLTIKGAIAEDQIGIHEAEFLQLGKKNDKYDMVIRSEHVDKSTNEVDTGAIYVLWDINDYANQNVSIDPATANAFSSLLTIYGATGNSMLGSSNVLYSADNEDSDVDGDGTNDLVFANGSHTYVLFGDKIATTTGTGEEAKVDSKTIDLGSLGGFVNKNGEDAANGFFGGDPDVALGYRFADNRTTFKEVKDGFPQPPPSLSLSDADADLGVWDIA